MITPYQQITAKKTREKNETDNNIVAKKQNTNNDIYPDF